MCLISIVIPNYNYGRFADRFFSSLAAQTFSLADVQILFVDDGSTDDSMEQAVKWSGRLECASFEILTPARSGRPGPVRNYGLERARGEYLCCLDPDDTFHPEFLESCLDVLRRNSGGHIVYTDYLEKSSENSREVFLPEFKPVYLRTQNVIPSATVFHRKVWDSGARYPANTAYEDWDFWIQCVLGGFRFRHISGVRYTYERHEAGFTGLAEQEDGRAKAQIVLNNPEFFHPTVVCWAHDFFRGRPYAPAFSRGRIPSPEDVVKVLKLFE